MEQDGPADRVALGAGGPGQGGRVLAEELGLQVRPLGVRRRGGDEGGEGEQPAGRDHLSFFRFTTIRMWPSSSVDLKSVGRSVAPGRAKQKVMVSPSIL